MEHNILNILLLYLAGINLIAIGAYGVDKYKAKRNRWRIPEHTLLALAFVGGGLGAALGMKLFHHKTRKTKFRVGVPIALLLWLVALGWLAYRFADWLV